MSKAEFAKRRREAHCVVRKSFSLAEQILAETSPLSYDRDKLLQAEKRLWSLAYQATSRYSGANMSQKAGHIWWAWGVVGGRIREADRQGEKR